MNEIVQVISAVGFPIVAAIACGMFIKWQYEQNAKDMVKNDLSLPVSLYQIVAEYSVTDLTPDKMTYLASEAVNYTFDMDNIYDLPGKTVPDANNVHEEFHVDEEALYDMIVEIFYEPVE